MHPRISVIIPCFNEEKYIGKCLESLKKQTFQDFEIIVVDNNCTDKTAQIARAYGARVVKESKQGIIWARDRGFREAQTDIIARTDADATVDENWVKVIFNAFQKNPDVVAVTGPNLPPTTKTFDKTIRAYSYIGANVLGPLISNHVYLMGPNMGLRKSAWQKADIHTDDRKVHEDIDLSIHLAQIGEIRYLPDMKIYASLRKIYADPIKGLKLYLGEYGIKLIRTIWLHKKINKKVFESRMKGLKMLSKQVNYRAVKQLIFSTRHK